MEPINKPPRQVDKTSAGRFCYIPRKFITRFITHFYFYLLQRGLFLLNFNSHKPRRIGVYTVNLFSAGRFFTGSNPVTSTKGRSLWDLPFFVQITELSPFTYQAYFLNFELYVVKCYQVYFR